MVDTLILLVIAALAVARITTLIVRDTILDPVRHEVFLLSPPPDAPGIRAIPYRQVDRVPWRKRRRGVPSYTVRNGRPARRQGFIGSLLSCERCAGVWVTLGVVGAYAAAPDLTIVVAVILAVAQVSLIATRAGD